MWLQTKRFIADMPVRKIVPAHAECAKKVRAGQRGVLDCAASAQVVLSERSRASKYSFRRSPPP
jgi:hypothetical protein